MKKTIHALALIGLVSSSAGCKAQPEEVLQGDDDSILDQYMNDDAQVPVEDKDEDETSVDTITETAPVSTVGAYKDGTYSASGTYQSPAGKEALLVSITVKDNLVSSVNVTPKSENSVSLKLQGAFKDGIGELVVGKSLDEIGNYSSVNGSSLTPKGFDAALSQIRGLAK